MDDMSPRELQTLIESNTRARDAQFEALLDRLASEKSELIQRLSHMNEFREAMADQQTRFVTRGEFEEAKQASGDRYEQGRLQTAAQQRGVLTSSISLMVAVIAGAWLIIGLKIDNTVAPMRIDVEQTRTVGAQNAERLRFVEQLANASTQADTASHADRSQLNERVHQLETQSPSGQATAAEVGNLKTAFATISDRLQDMRTRQTEMNAALIEIETQFCGADNLRSQIHSQDLRWQAMLWHKVFGEVMPTDQAFYARVGRCGATAN